MADLGLAGCKVWMLTGDQRETAINIGRACRLIAEDARVLEVTGGARQAAAAEAALASVAAAGGGGGGGGKARRVQLTGRAAVSAEAVRAAYAAAPDAVVLSQRFDGNWTWPGSGAADDVASSFPTWTRSLVPLGALLYEGIQLQNTRFVRLGALWGARLSKKKKPAAI